MNHKTVIFGCKTYRPLVDEETGIEETGIDLTFQRHREVDGLIAAGAFEVFENIDVGSIKDMISALQAIADANEAGRCLEVYTDLDP